MSRKTKLYPYQREGVLHIERQRGRTLLADDMGIGKTLQGLVWHHRNPATWPCVVVCPAFVKDGWENEAATHAGIRARVLNSRTPPRGRLGGDNANLYIINYDILPKWVPWLLARGINSAIIDEAHYLQNLESKRTQAVFKLCATLDHIVALTGTPLTNRPRDLYPILALLYPRRFRSRQKFYSRFCDPQLRRWGWTFDGARRLPELHELLKKVGVLRRLKEDVIKGLPPKVITVTTLPIRDRPQYETANNDFIGWLKRISQRRARRVKKVEKLAKVGYLLRLASKLKLKAIAKWVDHFLAESDEKLVLYFVHHKAIDAMARYYRGRCVVADGRVPVKDRHLAVKKFQHDKRCRLFIGNVQAAGTGINGLQHAARNVALCELDPRPGINDQAIDRLHRIGQTGTVLVWFLIAHDTIEERYCKLIQTKSKNIRRILDGRGRGAVLDIMDRLMLEMQRDGR